MSLSIQSGVEVVLLAATTSGVLDLIAATILIASMGVPPKRMLQTIASAQMAPKRSSPAKMVPH
jgi:N-acetylmuramic acid 6-phosphate (MurNAc-6-P) etherase